MTVFFCKAWFIGGSLVEYVLLIVGFALLIKGADLFVDGSSAVAKLLKVPSIIIGLTVVALGTSLPEASISINAAILGQNSLALSNVLGSNIFNLLVVLGASALLCPVRAGDGVIKKEMPYNILITAVLFVCLLFGMAAGDENVWAAVVGNESSFTLGRIGGIILLLLFAFYLFMQIRGALKAREADRELDAAEEGKKISLWKSLIFIVIGAVAIIFGGDIVVDSASKIAETFGMSETLIGLTIVSMGTSLPELVTSVVAARKGESDLALGNAIGSSIFNILFILGASAAISPITVGVSAMCDTLILIAFSVLTWIFAATKKKISRVEGGIMLLTYAAYLAYIIVR